LKSGGALTVALDSGTIHSYVDQEPSLTIYTALLQAQPLSIGGAPQDSVVSLDANGGLSVRAVAGAVRIEQQLSGQVLSSAKRGRFSQQRRLNGMKPGAGHGSCEPWRIEYPAASAADSVPATAAEVSSVT